MTTFTRCQAVLLDGSASCEARAVAVPHAPTHSPNRPGVSAFCDQHGGHARAMKVAASAWVRRAPPSLGDGHESFEAIQSAGKMLPDSRTHTVSVHRDPTHDRPRWLAAIGVGSLARYLPGWWATEAGAVAGGFAAALQERERQVEHIRQVRGGTLEWGIRIHDQHPVQLKRGTPAWDGEREKVNYDRAVRIAKEAMRPNMSAGQARRIASEWFVAGAFERGVRIKPIWHAIMAGATSPEQALALAQLAEIGA